MQLNEINYSDIQPVGGYGPGFFRIGGEVYSGPVLTGPTGTGLWGGFDDIDSLLALSDIIDVLFIGTGADIAHLPAPFRTALETAGIGVESMSSPAAARTYNVVISEGRRAALAMVPV